VKKTSENSRAFISQKADTGLYKSKIRHLVEMEQCTLKYKVPHIGYLLRICMTPGNKGKLNKMRKAFWIFN